MWRPAAAGSYAATRCRASLFVSCQRPTLCPRMIALAQYKRHLTPHICFAPSDTDQWQIDDTDDDNAGCCCALALRASVGASESETHIGSVKHRDFRKIAECKIVIKQHSQQRYWHDPPVADIAPHIKVGPEFYCVSVRTR